MVQNFYGVLSPASPEGHNKYIKSLRDIEQGMQDQRHKTDRPVTRKRWPRLLQHSSNGATCLTHSCNKGDAGKNEEDEHESK